MAPRPPRGRPARMGSERGATLAALMVTLAVMSLMLTVAAQQWSFLVRRELEAELIHRGERIQRALAEAEGLKRPITKLEDLTKRPNPLLPRIPPDPMTARYDADGKLVPGTGEWNVIHVNPTATHEGQRTSSVNTSPIRGVASSSKELSIGAWGDVPAGSSYEEWKFLGPLTGANAIIGAVPQFPLRYPPGFAGFRAPGAPPLPPTNRTTPVGQTPPVPRGGGPASGGGRGVGPGGG